MIGVVRAAQNRQLQLLADAKIGTTAGAQSYTLPSGTQYIDIELYGGGGGGGGGTVISTGRSSGRAGGAGGGGGGYVRHGFTGAFGGDTVNFTVGSGGTANAPTSAFVLDQANRGTSGGNTSLTSITRSGNTVTTFSGIVSYGGFGGGVVVAGPVFPKGATGGQALNGNISNRPGLSGITQVQTSTVTQNGGTGGAGGNNDANVAGSIGLSNGGAGGSTAQCLRAGIGGNALTDLAGAGGGGGGLAMSFGATFGGGVDQVGATGGMGGIRIRVYG